MNKIHLLLLHNMAYLDILDKSYCVIVNVLRHFAKNIKHHTEKKSTAKYQTYWFYYNSTIFCISELLKESVVCSPIWFSASILLQRFPILLYSFKHYLFYYLIFYTRHSSLRKSFFWGKNKVDLWAYSCMFYEKNL